MKLKPSEVDEYETRHTLFSVCEETPKRAVYLAKQEIISNYCKNITTMPEHRAKMLGTRLNTMQDPSFVSFYTIPIRTQANALFNKYLLSRQRTYMEGGFLQRDKSFNDCEKSNKLATTQPLIIKWEETKWVAIACACACILVFIIEVIANYADELLNSTTYLRLKSTGNLKDLLRNIPAILIALIMNLPDNRGFLNFHRFVVHLLMLSAFSGSMCLLLN